MAQLSASRIYRRLRFGKPIVVVSGLPRSGTSMAMGMLSAGGLDVVSDGLRTADESNPKGYFEFERVKELDKAADKSWLKDTRGKAIKIIWFLLPHLPDDNNYRVIFMHRPMAEVIASQNRMLHARGESAGASTDEVMAAHLQSHLALAKRELENRRCFTVLDIQYGDVTARPLQQAESISRFLGGALDVRKMAAAVDAGLHRQRTSAHSATGR